MASLARDEDHFSVTMDALPNAAPPPAGPPRVRGKPEGFKRLNGRPPAMPASVRQRGIHGTVALDATIQTGGILTVIVTLVSPDTELEQACRASIEQWRYAPMKLDGLPVRSNTLITGRFTPFALI